MTTTTRWLVSHLYVIIKTRCNPSVLDASSVPIKILWPLIFNCISRANNFQKKERFECFLFSLFSSCLGNDVEGPILLTLHSILLYSRIFRKFACLRIFLNFPIVHDFWLLRYCTLFRNLFQPGNSILIYTMIPFTKKIISNWQHNMVSIKFFFICLCNLLDQLFLGPSLTCLLKRWCTNLERKHEWELSTMREKIHSINAVKIYNVANNSCKLV